MGRGNISIYLTIVVINSSPTSEACMGGGGGTYRTMNVVSHRCTLPTSASVTRLLTLVSRLGGSERMGNVLYRLPLPGKLSSRLIVGTVSPGGSISTFDTRGIKRVVVNSRAFLPYAPTKVVRVLGCCGVSIYNGRYIIMNEDGVINGPVTVLLLRRGNAIAVYRSGAGGLGRIAHHTSVLITTINGPCFMATSVMGSNTIIVSMNVSEGDRNGLYNSISFTRMDGGTSCVAPIPNNMNPVAVTALLGGAIATTGRRGNLVWVLFRENLCFRQGAWVLCGCNCYMRFTWTTCQRRL